MKFIMSRRQIQCSLESISSVNEISNTSVLKGSNFANLSRELNEAAALAKGE